MSTKLFLPSLLECKLANDPCRSNTFTTGYVFHTITDMKLGMSLALFKDAWKDAGLTGSLAFNKIRSSFATKVSTSYHKSVDIVYNFLSSLSSTKSCQNCPMYQMWYKHRWHSILAKYTLACRLEEPAIEPLTFRLADDRFPSSVKSSKFAYTPDTSLVSYVPKKGTNVVLCTLSTLYRDERICGQVHQKPEIVMDYNATKGGMKNMDKLVTAYQLRKEDPILATGDILWHLSVQCPCQLDGTEPRVEHR